MNAFGVRCPIVCMPLSILLAGLGCTASQDMVGTDGNIAIQFALDSVALQPGDSIPMSGRVSEAGGNEAITMSVTGLPAGVMAHVTEGPTMASSTVSIVLVSAAAVTPGKYRFTVSAGTSDNGQASVGIDLRIVPVSTASYRIIVPASPVIIAPNHEIDVSIGLSRAGYTGAVSLLADHLPAGLTGFFHPNPVTGDSTTLQLTASVGDTAGTYTIWVRGLTAALADQIAEIPVSIVLNSAGATQSGVRHRP